jgi:hypothetical protein
MESDDYRNEIKLKLFENQFFIINLWDEMFNEIPEKRPNCEEILKYRIDLDSIMRTMYLKDETDKILSFDHSFILKLFKDFLKRNSREISKTSNDYTYLDKFYVRR